MISVIFLRISTLSCDVNTTYKSVLLAFLQTTRASFGPKSSAQMYDQVPLTLTCTVPSTLLGPPVSLTSVAKQLYKDMM